MFSTLTKLALGATLIVGSVAAQQRTETVSVNPPFVGFVADVVGSNFNGFSVIGVQASFGGFSFGNGTIASRPFGSSNTVGYTYGTGSNQLTFKVTPGAFPWNAWCSGLGNAQFDMGN